MEKNDPYSDQIYSYLVLRNSLGWIGILLPFILLLGNSMVFGCNCIEDSISRYYYTGMRDVLVGALCAIALFLLFYKGYNDWDKRWRINWDKWSSTLAGVCAILVALFPGTENGPVKGSGIVHVASAAIFFGTMAAISCCLFTIKSKEKAPTPRKLKRNIVYKLCGIIIVICLVAMGVFYIFLNDSFPGSSFIYWTETLALVAFGVSWITKGGTLLPDKVETVDENDLEE
jgi:amino acid transporter